MIMVFLAAAGAYRQGGDIRTSLARAEAAEARYESTTQAYARASEAYNEEMAKGVTEPNRAAMETAYAAVTVAWHELWERRRDANATAYVVPAYPLGDNTSELAVVADVQARMSRKLVTAGLVLLGGIIGQGLFLLWLYRRKPNENLTP
jgi:phosphohistidine phosphatase SixA